MDKKLIMERAGKMAFKVVGLGTIAVLGEAVGVVATTAVNETAKGDGKTLAKVKELKFEDLFGIK